jgi:hypothetical protein
MTYFQILTRERYSSLLDKLPDPPTFELTVTSIVERLLRHLNLQEQDQDVYVIVGLDCTNIYSTEYEGRPVTVLCLETTNEDFREIELLFAHEVHHWKRQSLIPHNIFEFSVYERCATEGLQSASRRRSSRAGPFMSIVLFHLNRLSGCNRIYTNSQRRFGSSDRSRPKPHLLCFLVVPSGFPYQECPQEPAMCMAICGQGHF